MNSWGMEWNLDAEQRERMQRLSRQPGKGTARAGGNAMKFGTMIRLARHQRVMQRERGLQQSGLLASYRQRAAEMIIARPPKPGEMAEAARRVVHVQRLFRPVFPKPLPRHLFVPCGRT